MAQDKDERPSASRKTGEASEEATKRGATAAGRFGQREATNGGDAGLAASPPPSRREHFLIGYRAVPGIQPFGSARASMDSVVDYLSRQENVEIVTRLRLGGTQPFSSDSAANEFVVAKIDESKAQRLRAAAPPYLIIERDSRLTCSDYVSGPAWRSLGTLLPLRSVTTEVTIRVVGERDQPLPKATVVVEGDGLPTQALTDESGTARITVFGGSIESIQTLFVRAAANHWDRLIHAPRLGTGVNTVKLRPISELYPNFPNQSHVGWGQRLMRLDPVGSRFSGSGVKIGIIDSGCDTSHPLLRHITHGKDFTDSTETGWTQDHVSHGTHCAGIIAAASTGQGTVGCAPDAEVHVFKVVPDGRVSDLLVAVDECIEREVDLINIGVVCEEFSELLSQKLQEARLKGIACVAAAGNTAGTVAFPALLPWVLAVGAIGKLREFPADSSHILSVLPQLIGNDGIFATRFSAVGPQLAVSAPGVAVVSTVPGGYAAADGTSVAAAHVTGFAALVLAHHPLFQEGSLRMRTEQRVHALFELVRTSAMPHFGDPMRGGAGVPDLQRVPGAQSAGITLPDAVERGAIPYWPLAREWPTLMQMRTAGLY
jgi:subtilisin family serine protease